MVPFSILKQQAAFNQKVCYRWGRRHFRTQNCLCL